MVTDKIAEAMLMSAEQVEHKLLDLEQRCNYKRLETVCESFEHAMVSQTELRPQTGTYTTKVVDLVDMKREAEKLMRTKTRQRTTVAAGGELKEVKKRDVKAKEKGLVSKSESKLKRARH